MEDLGFPLLGADDLLAFRIHRINDRFMTEMHALGFDELTPKEALRLRIYDVDRVFRDRMQNLGFSGFTPNRLVVMKMLRVNESLLRELSGKTFEEISIEGLLRDRNNWSGRMNRYDDDLWEAIEDVVRELTRMY